VCGLVAGVLEAVHPARRNHHGRARPRDDPLEAEAEGHRAADELEALLLLGVRVRPRHGAAGREHQLELSSSPSVSAAVWRKRIFSPLMGFSRTCPACAISCSP
jgi:hypothetical protein